MLTRLRLMRFKSFEDAELSMGPFTLLVGANASGKSNVREALRLLHGVGCGHTLEEIFEGLRGGAAEAAFRKETELALEVDVPMPVGDLRYIASIDTRSPPRFVSEGFQLIRSSGVSSAHAPPPLEGTYSRSYLAQASQDIDRGRVVVHDPRLVPLKDPFCGSFREMRFVDLSPREMRKPSTLGQDTLSDRGENLSSVLQTLCSSEPTKAKLLQWIRFLVPADVVDVQFSTDVHGQVLFALVEKDGTALSAPSISEGTLRFLGVLAALLSPAKGLFFFEEIENGLHPSRLRLLVDFLRERTRTGEIQVVATTHSPTFLARLDDEMLKHVSLVHRVDGEPSARITRLLDIPDAKRVLATHDRAELLASGWFEDMIEFGAVPREPTRTY
jgi:predicted ATPase